MLRDASQHLGTDLFTIVKGKHIAGESGMAKETPINSALSFPRRREPS